MKLIITDIKSAADRKLITALAERLGMKVSTYEDLVLGKAMKKADKGRRFSKKEALNFL